MPFSGVSKSYKRHKSTSAANIYNCSQVLLAIRTWATRRFRGQNRRNYSSHEWLEHGTSLWTNFQVCRLLLFLIFSSETEMEKMNWIMVTEPSRKSCQIILTNLIQKLTQLKIKNQEAKTEKTIHLMSGTSLWTNFQVCWLLFYA